MKPTKQQIEQWLEKCGYEPGKHVAMLRCFNGVCYVQSIPGDEWIDRLSYATPLRIFTRDGSKQIGEDFKMPSKRKRVFRLLEQFGFRRNDSQSETLVESILKALEVEE